MEVKSRCSFLGYGRTGLLSSGAHHTRWVDTAGARDRLLFVLNLVSHGSGGEKADVLSLPHINPGAGFKPSLWFSRWHKQRCAEPPTVCFRFSTSLDEQTPFRAIDH
jgi:hypothetical protein